MSIGLHQLCQQGSKLPPGYKRRISHSVDGKLESYGPYKQRPVTAPTKRLCWKLQVIATLKGHLDCSFASAWHPDGQVFLTGNQDTTFHLWDIQNLGSSLGALKGYIGAIHSLPFTSKGCFLAMAEPADFVHVFDTKQDCAKCQEIDLLVNWQAFPSALILKLCMWELWTVLMAAFLSSTRVILTPMSIVFFKLQHLHFASLVLWVISKQACRLAGLSTC